MLLASQKQHATEKDSSPLNVERLSSQIKHRVSCSPVLPVDITKLGLRSVAIRRRNWINAGTPCRERQNQVLERSFPSGVEGQPALPPVLYAFVTSILNSRSVMLIPRVTGVLPGLEETDRWMSAGH
ncbi:unnamed protein product [Leuciscus chuanchicus]